MQEIWNPVVGYEGCYEVSNLGAVRSVGRYIPSPWGLTRWVPQTTLSRNIGSRGYVRVTLNANGKKKQGYCVHRLVAMAFIQNPSGLPQVNHIDGNKTNNHISNLEWCTSKENCLHARTEKLYEPARGEKAGGSKLKESQVLDIRARIAAGETHKAIASDFNVARPTITKIANGTRWAQPMIG